MIKRLTRLTVIPVESSKEMKLGTCKPFFLIWMADKTNRVGASNIIGMMSNS
tara:strand:- start:45705 stop:45860 length:156 start_codon:yes stop_codon:yes gene_type:complete